MARLSEDDEVAFDAFVAGDEDVRLSTRFDTLDGKNVFAEQFKLVPGWNRNLMFNLKALRYQLDLTQVKSFLLYAEISERQISPCQFNLIVELRRNSDIEPNMLFSRIQFTQEGIYSPDIAEQISQFLLVIAYFSAFNRLN